MESERPRRSAYMEWAKTRSHARFNLATSGVAEFPVSELNVAPAEVIAPGQSLYGHPPLQERIAARYGVHPDGVVAAQGTSMANHLAMAALVDPGDEVLIEHPTYELLVTTAAYLGAQVRRFPRRAEDGFRLDPAAVAERVSARTRLVVVTNLHNPSSAMCTSRELEEVGEAARRVGARVLVDEVYLDSLFEDAPPSAVHLGPEFVATGSLTKVYGLGGLRCGWALAAPELARRMWRLNDLFGVTAAHVAERLSVAAFDELPRLAERSRSLLLANREAYNRFLAGAGPALDARPARRGLVAFPRLVRGDVDALAERLRREHETTVVPGRFFDMPAHFRVSLGCPTTTLAGGLERLAAALAASAGEGPDPQ